MDFGKLFILSKSLLFLPACGITNSDIGLGHSVNYYLMRVVS